MEAEPPTRVRVYTQPEEEDTHRGQVGTQGGVEKEVIPPGGSPRCVVV
jgi:hypothetical protein